MSQPDFSSGHTDIRLLSVKLIVCAVLFTAETDTDTHTHLHA